MFFLIIVVVSTPITRINSQSLQLEMWFIFNLKNNTVNVGLCYVPVVHG
jgi:hypothetical protein